MLFDAELYWAFVEKSVSNDLTFPRLFLRMMMLISFYVKYKVLRFMIINYEVQFYFVNYILLNLIYQNQKSRMEM